MIKQIGKKIICGPLSPIASLAFDFISSYLPEQGINSFDTDFINYIVLHKKDNSDDTKIVYVTTKPSYGYFYEDGNSLSEIKVFDKEEELKNSIINDAEFEEYDTSILEEMSVEQASTLYSSDLNNDGSVSNQEIGKKVIKVTLKDYKGKDWDYYLDNRESILDRDVRYLNSTYTSDFLTKKAIDGTISEFEPYAENTDNGEIIRMSDSLSLTNEDIANFVPSSDKFLKEDDAKYLYEYQGSLPQFDSNIFVVKEIVLENVVTSIATSDINLLNYPACFVEAGNKSGDVAKGAIYGDIYDCVEYIEKNCDSNKDYNIYIGKECVIDKNLTLPKNVKIKISYDVSEKAEFPIAQGSNRIANKTGIAANPNKDAVPGHLTITNGATLTPTFEGYTLDSSGKTQDWAHGNDAAITVFSKFYAQKAGNPVTYTSAGILTIDEGSSIVINNNVWMRAFGLIEGEGDIIVNNGGRLMQQISSFDWMADYYYDPGEKIFITQKFSLDNVYCDVHFKKNASFVLWLAMKTEYDNFCNTGRTTDAYITLLGDKDASGYTCGKSSSGNGIMKQSLFGISSNKESDEIIYSRKENEVDLNLYNDFNDFSLLNSKRNYKTIFDFNCDVGLGDLKISSASIEDYWFPVYNMDLNFNGSANLIHEGRLNSWGLMIKVLPGSSVSINDLATFNCDRIVTYNASDYCNFVDSFVEAEIKRWALFGYTTKKTYDLFLTDKMVNINKNAPDAYVRINEVSNKNEDTSIEEFACNIIKGENLYDISNEELIDIIKKKAKKTTCSPKEIKQLKESIVKDIVNGSPTSAEIECEYYTVNRELTISN